MWARRRLSHAKADAAAGGSGRPRTAARASKAACGCAPHRSTVTLLTRAPPTLGFPPI
jgi:hypothetical protein